MGVSIPETVPETEWGVSIPETEWGVSIQSGLFPKTFPGVELVAFPACT